MTQTTTTDVVRLIDLTTNTTIRNIHYSNITTLLLNVVRLIMI